MRQIKLILNCKWSLGTVFPSDGSERGVCETSSCMSSEVCETNRLSLCCYLSVWLQDVNPVTSCSVCLSASRVRWGRVCPVLINRCVDLLTSGAWRRRVTLLKSAWKAIECHSDSFFLFFFFALNSVGFIVFTFYCFVSEQTRSFALLRSSSALLKKGAVVRPCWLQFKCVICCKLVCPLNKTRERLQNDPKITFPNANSLIICFIVQLVLAVSLISLTWKSAIVAVLTNTGIT